MLKQQLSNVRLIWNGKLYKEIPCIVFRDIKTICRAIVVPKFSSTRYLYSPLHVCFWWRARNWCYKILEIGLFEGNSSETSTCNYFFFLIQKKNKERKNGKILQNSSFGK